MLAAASTLLLRLALCAAVGWVLWHRLGPGTVVVCSPLAALALRRPIVDFVVAAHRHSQETAVGDRQGRFFQHKGAAIDIVDDDDGHRWLLAADVRKVLAAFPRDEVLQRLYTLRAGLVEGETGFRIRADALLEHLAVSTEPASIRFKRWLDADVVKPAANARG